MTMRHDIVPVETADSIALSDLALRSKAHWGYDAVFLEACRAELAITPTRIANEEIWKAVDDSGRLLGFYALDIENGDGEIMDVFVEPSAIGDGVGRALFDHMFERAKTLGCRTLFVDADPNAEGYYKRMGFVPCGRSPSGSIPGRVLPRLRLPLNADAESR